MATSEQSIFARDALRRHRQEGTRLAVKARLWVLGTIMVLMPILNPSWTVLYFEAIALLFAAIGFVQLRLVNTKSVWAEVAVFSADFALLTVVLLAPRPYGAYDMPDVAIFRYVEFSYFFVYLALGTIAYSWQAIRIVAVLGALFWTVGVVVVVLTPDTHPSGAAVREALAAHPFLRSLIDPESPQIAARIQEVVLFALVAFTLSVTVKRFGDLLLEHVAVDRQRTNLSRYFSPNMIEELSANDNPLEEIRVQEIAVLFVDIVGFTTYANSRSPEEVIQTLRDFHARMEHAVFDNHGTLDKFLGDGVMATFGTPTPGKCDASNALKCARDMINAIEKWNLERVSDDSDQELSISIGIHYGPCVLGDIGGENRLEFAVIGDPVNIASRVEAKTREHGVNILLTEAFAARIRKETGEGGDPLIDFTRFNDQTIRGLTDAVTLYGL
ncbi:adenylate/guanylate cyclase domain-containing protein [Roseibium sp.]|uniref:adenylate/guanylate cyclase domain-containing protein n=2 Tax=unclassified Roseibium TaxID=2629323 RepID=UPI003BAB484B